VASRRAKLEERAEDGDRRARHAVRVHKRLSFMLSGAQLGITVTTLVVGFIAEPTIGAALEPAFGAVGLPEGARAATAVVAAFVIATVGQMVVGELAPKNLAIARPEPVARAVATSMAVFIRVAAPVIRFFDGSANRLLRVVGIEPVEEISSNVSVEELDLMVEESAQQGLLTQRQAALLTRAVGFGRLRASNVMVPWNAVATLPEHATGDDLRRAMGSSHSRFPLVSGGGDLVGVVHAKALLAVPADRVAQVAVAELARDPLFVPESAGVRVVLGALRREATEMAVVVDEYGEPSGVVTLEDLVEELVGDIADEYDPDGGDLKQDDDGAWAVPGDWRIDEIARATGIRLPEGDYDTVAGLVLERLQREAAVGDHVLVAGVRVEVVGVDHWAITGVRLLVDPGAEPGAGG
jgi:CBS domain containing-hemolysin-like protein